MKLYGLNTAVGLVLLTSCAAPTPVHLLDPSATATVTASATPAPATTVPTISSAAAAYLEAAIAIMEAKGINRLRLDWNEVRADAFNAAQHAQTPADTYDITRWILKQAGGPHSAFLTPDQATVGQNRTMSDSPPPRGKLLLERLGYVAVEGFDGNDEAAQYATLVQQLLRDVDAQAPCGWIVDLRENTGGNMYPMLAGLGPILGEGVAGTFVDPDGQETPWSYANGQALYEDEVLVRVDGPPYTLKTAEPPVAVLTGINTASAGEAMVISFRGRPNTRSFGHYTAGLSTGNAGYPLSDGAMLVLTGVVMADRDGQAYGAHIHPDVKVDDVRQYTLLMDDAIPQPAIDWLLAQPACTMQS